MEDKLIWTDTVTNYVLHGIGLDERILTMWGHLKSAVLYYLRFQTGQHTAEHLKEARDHLWEYSKLVQEHFSSNELLSYQLHYCMAHLGEQAAHNGPTALAGEWWLERCMQVFKRITKYRSTRHPECVGVNHFLALQALESMVSLTPLATRLYDAIAPSPRKKSNKDDTQGQEWLVGPLTEVTDAGEVRHRTP